MTQEMPGWSLRLTEQLISSDKEHSTPLPHVRYQKPNTKDDQQQTNQDLQVNTETLNNRLSQTSSKATTLRNSGYYDQPDYPKKEISKSQEPPPVPVHKMPQNEADSDSIEENVWWTMKDDHDGLYSIGALLFLFGFLCPLLWWLGSFWPTRIRERAGKMAGRWQKINRIMSIGFSSVLLILIIVFVVLYATNQL
ncbi:hypothetical protein EDC96DRAFT_571000 [Choanephora cucurbitarum]|nr:hypothetical protein EDC96DRAFT_571000 [Choanephora cucurbitarum]